MRYKRSVAVSQAFKKLKKNQYVPGHFFNNFVIWLRQAFGERLTEVKDFMTDWLDDKNKDIWATKAFIYNAEFIYPQDVQFSGCIKNDYGHIFNDYKVIDPYKNLITTPIVTGKQIGRAHV